MFVVAEEMFNVPLVLIFADVQMSTNPKVHLRLVRVSLVYQPETMKIRGGMYLPYQLLEYPE